MQDVHIELLEQFHTESYRCFNAVEMYFSLDGKLKIQHNGLNKELYYQVAIVNHSDLIKIHHAQALIKITIPLHILIETQPNFINGYFDDTKLYSHEQLRDCIQSLIIHHGEEQQYKTLHTMIQMLLKECYTPCEGIYMPKMQVDSDMFANVLNIIHKDIEHKITLQDLARSFFVSSSYISILFNEQLGFNFKSYTVTLKLSLSLPHLLWNNYSIYDIAQSYGFSNYSNYSKQFKSYIGMSPYTYKKHHLQIDTKIIVHHNSSKIFQQLNQNVAEDQSGVTFKVDLDAVTPPSLFKLPHVRLTLTYLDEMFAHEHFFNAFNDVLRQQCHYLYFEDSLNVKLTHHTGCTLEQMIRFMHRYHLHFSFKITSLYDYDVLETNFLNHIKKITRVIPALKSILPNVNIIFDFKSLTLKDIDYLSERFQHVFNSCPFELLLPHDTKRNINHYIQQSQHLKTTISGYVIDISSYVDTEDSHPSIRVNQHIIKYWQNLVMSHVVKDQHLSFSLIGLSPKIFEHYHHAHMLHSPHAWLYFLTHLTPSFHAINIPLNARHDSTFCYVNARHLNTMLPFISDLLRPFMQHYVKKQKHAIVKQTDDYYDILLLTDDSDKMIEVPEVWHHYQISSDLIRDKHLVIVRTYDDETMNARNLIQFDANTFIPSQHIQDVKNTLHLRQHILIHDFSKGPLDIDVKATQIKSLQIYKTSTSLLNDLN